MKVEFVVLTEENLAIVKEIYDYYIVNSTATYFTEKVSSGDVKEIIPIGHEKYKSFIIKSDGQNCGFCCISPYKKRQAYDRTAEVSVYLKPGFTGKGIGKEALNHLENIAERNGIAVLIGIISGDNENSINLFEGQGYEKCGHLRQVGEKFNKILDVVFYQKIL
jgi:L-amino acid N-acyltransferase YncA